MRTNPPDRENVLGDYSQQNGRVPDNRYTYYFRCPDCDVNWHSKENTSECWSCGRKVG